MRIFGLDPGVTESGWVMYDSVLIGSEETNAIYRCGIRDNNSMGFSIGDNPLECHRLAIERVRTFGQQFWNNTLLETAEWVGEFRGIWNYLGKPKAMLLPRKTIAAHICGHATANDTRIRQELTTRFGGKAAIGTKANPGPLYPIRAYKAEQGQSKDHIWAALAVAVTYADKLAEKK